MNPLLVTFPIAILFTIGFPLLLAWQITRRFQLSWLLVGVGALIFIASQVVHIALLQGIDALMRQGPLGLPDPENRVLVSAVIGGLAAGLCEETARLVGFRLLKPHNRGDAPALALGVGHGGIESILLAGLSLLFTFIAMLPYYGVDVNSVPAEAIQIAAAWNSSWDLPLAAAIERLSAIILQISLAVLVMQVFTRGNLLFYVAAVVWHAIVDGIAVYALGNNLTGVWGLEAIVLGLALISAAGAYGLWKTAPRKQPAALPGAAFLIAPGGEQP
jgi:uncharacterized membrane protein YhfC